jgi:hypothetical protein
MGLKSGYVEGSQELSQLPFLQDLTVIWRCDCLNTRIIFHRAHTSPIFKGIATDLSLIEIIVETNNGTIN